MDAKALERSFLALYEGYADSVFRHIHFRVSDRELATDLTQEAFTKVWDYLASGKSIENQKAFLFRTAHNLIVDYYRSKKEASLEVLAEQGFDPAGDDGEQVMAKAEGREVLAALEILEGDHKQVVVLRYVNDLSISEIAEIMGESENAVSVRIHRAVKRLKDYFQNGKA